MWFPSVVCVAMGTTANDIGVGGLPRILSIQPGSMGAFAICMGIAICVPLILTVAVGKRFLNKEKTSAVQKENEE